MPCRESGLPSFKNAERFAVKSPARKIERDVELRLCVALERLPREMPRPPVERVEGKRFAQLRLRFAIATEPPQHQCAQIAGTEGCRY